MNGFRPPTRGSSPRRSGSDSASRPWICWSRRRPSWTGQLWSPGIPRIVSRITGLEVVAYW